MSTKDFINKANQVHNNQYNYSKVTYTGSRTKIIIICEHHGEFEQRADSHLGGAGCPKCKYNNPLAKTMFIEKANKFHKNKYDYSLVDYLGSHTKIKIICPIHGEFEQRPWYHLYGGCPLCTPNNTPMTKESFIERANQVHNNFYDYSNVDFISSQTSVSIRCPIHDHIFKQTPSAHLRGIGCQICGKTKIGDSLRKSPALFILEANKKHNNLYDYSLVEYTGSKTKVKIICQKHGIFEQTPSNHLKGQGCPHCLKSFGENKVESFLKTNNIKYIPQKKFPDCKHTFELPFDFFLPEFNVCIEYDGRQHFYPMFGEESFNRLKVNDRIKDEYCDKNQIKLIRIKYTEFKQIDSLLSAILETYEKQVPHPPHYQVS
jgi:very-short-patch-repair endonuclease